MKSLKIATTACLKMITAIIVLGMAAACSDGSINDPVTPDVPVTPSDTTKKDTVADYTVMFYGVSDTILDWDLYANIEDVQKAKNVDNVNFTALVKYSQKYQIYPVCRGTRLINVCQGKTTNDSVNTVNYRMDDPENIAAFIKDAKKRLPAKKYVFVLWDHGDAISINDHPLRSANNNKTTRSMFSDPHNGTQLSVFELEEAFRLAGEKMEMLYFDMCMTGNIETLYQIKDYFNYIMASEHTVPETGGDYTAFMEGLAQNTEDITTFGGKYIDNVVAVRWGNYGLPVDISLYDTSKMDELINSIKDYTTSLVEYRDNLLNTDTVAYKKFAHYNMLDARYTTGYQKENFADSTNNEGVLYPNWNDKDYGGGVDLCSGFTRIAEKTQNSELITKAAAVDKAFRAVQLHQKAINIPDWLEPISCSIMWWPYFYYVDKHSVKEEFKATDTLQKLYPNLAFDKKTGWSKFLDYNYSYYDALPE